MDSTPTEALDCVACGACCRGAFDVVPVDPEDPMGPHPAVTREHLDGWRSMAFVPGACGGTQCAALSGDDAVGWRCTIYEDRPIPCHELEVGSKECRRARRLLGVG